MASAAFRVVAIISLISPAFGTENSPCPELCTCSILEVKCNDGYVLSKDHFALLSTTIENITVDNFVIRTINSSDFQTFTELKVLQLTGNRIRHINEDSFVQLSKLTTLSLENNQINELYAGTFQSQRVLEYLNLGRNLLESLSDGIFSNLTSSMRRLYLHQNRLRFVSPNLFDTLTHLEYLDLSSNELSYILPRTFHSISNVIHVDLTDNLLVTLHQDLFISRNISKQTSLSLAKNPLACNCGLRWLRKALLGQNQGITLVNGSSILCASPQLYRKRPFSSAGLEELNCTTPSASTTNANVVVFQRNPVELRCELSGDPYPSVVWLTPVGDYISDPSAGEWLDLSVTAFSPKKEYKIYATGETVAFVLRSVPGYSILAIDSMHRISAGQYVCIAMNPGGQSNASFSVVLKSAIDHQYLPSLMIGSFTVIFGILLGIIGCAIRACVEKCMCCASLNRPIKYYDGEMVPMDPPANPGTSKQEPQQADFPSEPSCSSTGPDITDQTDLTAEEWDEYFREYPDDFEVEGFDGIPKRMGSPKGRTLETLEGVRVLLKLRVEQIDVMKERLRVQMEKRRLRMRENMERRKERMNKRMQTIKESTSQSLQSIRETGRNYSHKIHHGVRTAMENVGAHVQSLKEFCGTGDLGQTISVATITTDVDTNEKSAIIRSVTMV